jgi:adenosylhomocysteine nucleosidase
VRFDPELIETVRADGCDLAAGADPMAAVPAGGECAASTDSRTQGLLAGRLVIALVGLAFEARVAAGPDVLVVCHQKGRDLADLIRNAIRSGCRSMISFGIAGGLAPDLRPGDWIVASAILGRQRIWPTDPAWSNTLLRAVPGSRYAPILGVDAPVAEPAAKRRLYATSGAMAVDMESHVVAELADAHDLSFAAVRVVIDPAYRLLPQAALVGMRRDGSTDLPAVIRELMIKPRQTLALLRLAADLFVARSTLSRVRQSLGPGFGYHGLQ